MAAPLATSHDEKATAATTGRGVDTDKVNDLMANLNKRLAGGLHGEFFEQGSKMADSKRHGQLDGMFTLCKQLEALKKEESASKVAYPEVESKGKKAALANANMVATMKAVAQEQLSQPLRDLQIKSERLEQRVKQVETRDENRMTKAKGPETVYKQAMERLEQRVMQAEDRYQSWDAKLQAVEDAHRESNERLEQRLEQAEDRDRSKAKASKHWMACSRRPMGATRSFARS